MENREALDLFIRDNFSELCESARNEILTEHAALDIPATVNPTPEAVVARMRSIVSDLYERVPDLSRWTLVKGNDGTMLGIHIAPESGQ